MRAAYVPRGGSPPGAPAAALALGALAASTVAVVWVVFERPPALSCETTQPTGQAASVTAWRTDALPAHMPVAAVALACIVVLTARRRRAAGRPGIGRPTTAALLVLAGLGAAASVEPEVLEAMVGWAVVLGFLLIPATAVVLIVLTLMSARGHRGKRAEPSARTTVLVLAAVAVAGTALVAGLVLDFFPFMVAAAIGLLVAGVLWSWPALRPRPHRLRLAWATLAVVAGLQAALLDDAPVPLAAGIALTGFAAALVERRSRCSRGIAALWLTWIVLGLLVPGSLGAALITGTDAARVCLD